MKLIDQSRLCWPCIAVGVISFAYGAAALAQSGITASPDYSAWFSLFAGLLAAMVGAYAKGMDTRIKDNRDDIGKLRGEFTEHKLTLARDHHTKGELRILLDAAVTTLTEKISENRATTRAVHRRLDKLNVPSAFPED
jgi:hypothetical protein